MRFAVILFCAVILLLLAGVLPVGKGLDAMAVYTSPVMILLLGLLSGSCLFCCFRRRSFGFILVHIGVVVLLAGAFVGYLVGTKGTLRLSLHSQRSQSHVQTRAGDLEPLEFSVAAENFQVEFYPPVYTLFRPLPPEEVSPGGMPFEPIGEFSTEGVESWAIHGHEVAVSNLFSNGQWLEQGRLADGSVLYRGAQVPSFYGVTLVVDDQKLPMRINHPAQYQGWRFYLVSYDPRSRSYVELSARHDPGRGAVIAGIWMVMVGTFVLCLRKESGKSSGRPADGEGT